MVESVVAASVGRPVDFGARLAWLGESDSADESFGRFCGWYAEQQLRDGLAEANGGQPPLARLQQVVILAHLNRADLTRDEALRALVSLGRRSGGLGAAARELAIVVEQSL